jgi:hypothetical protein
MKELVDFCEDVALSDDLDHPVLGKKATQFFAKTLIPRIQKAHQAWSHVDIVGIHTTPRTFFQGRYFASHVPKIFQDKVLAAPRLQQRACQITLHGHIYRIHVVSLKHRTETFFRDVFYKTYLWLSVCSAVASSECSHTLGIYLYLIPDKKLLPNKKGSVLKVEHVNTAFTRSCEPASEINIFREEEWFKVLIHETFHNHGFDFSQHFDRCTVMVQQQLRACFPALKSPVFLFESYCEIWAEALHTLLLAFLEEPGGSSVWPRFERMWRIERIFSRLQCVKMLEHHGVTYDQLRDARFTFEEHGTNVFAYYVIKCLMMHCGFLDWHLTVNGPSFHFSDTHVGKLCTWICKAHRDSDLVQSIRTMERQELPSTLVKKTLRMVAN